MQTTQPSAAWVMHSFISSPENVATITATSRSRYHVPASFPALAQHACWAHGAVTTLAPGLHRPISITCTGFGGVGGHVSTSKFRSLMTIEPVSPDWACTACRQHGGAP